MKSTSVPSLRVQLVSIVVAFFTFSTAPRAQQLTPAWVELGDDGAGFARVIVNSSADCPALQVDGKSQQMAPRQPTPSGFVPVCELAIPAKAKSVSLNGQKLPLPPANPSRIIALGDTGCRIKGDAIQDCNDPDQWPFAHVASEAAAEKPELVIHVGDYLYRESPCPAGSNAMCGGTPAGDNWKAWNADFFAPAAKLLAAAPWAFSRGNHEDCLRSWRGWFYYLDPHPWTGICAKYSPPYVITLGSFQLAMIDSSAVKEESLDEEQIAQYAAELSSLHLNNAWLVDHHPFWGFSSVAASLPPLPLSVPLEEAWNRVQPKGINLFLSGHVHLFEFVNFDSSRPSQLVIGDGGTDLAAPIPASIKGFEIRGANVSIAQSQRQFGFALLTKTASGWDFTLQNQLGKSLGNFHLLVPNTPAK